MDFRVIGRHRHTVSLEEWKRRLIASGFPPFLIERIEIRLCDSRVCVFPEYCEGWIMAYSLDELDPRDVQAWRRWQDTRGGEGS